MTQTNNFALGQRWLSNTESELGLGTIIAVNNRTVEILFPAIGETRTYAPASAPLTRVTFEVGDKVTSHANWQFIVENISQRDNMLTYHGKRLDTGEDVDLKETFVDHHFQLNQPQKRLLAGQVDEPKWFEMREKCITHQYQHDSSDLLGFLGARVDIIPHQLHIASEVGRRHAPRVLLADEVGLGKTIEAALIIHQQLLTGRAQRILIVVPNSLVHQWLVEMLRRVNLAFSIFDEERCQAMAEEAGNPFEAEQLILCSLDFLTHNSRYFQQACEAPWDLMVVDEAHHLTWSEGQPSQEYEVIEQLAQVTKGVLLLTATPDQLGHESHFARLRILDPARFHSYQEFVHEEQQYSKLAKAIEPLLAKDNQEIALDESAIQAIQEFAGEDLVSNLELADAASRDKLIHQLLDRHGTGRVLFRNSRSGVTGFPARELLSYPLQMPEEYEQHLEVELDSSRLLSPERIPELVDSWTDFDPRIDWFIDHLQQLRGEKVLTICAKASTALMLAEAIRRKSGIRAGVFHEGLSIVERDRTANYFAQSEEGAQVLICSEIGSEGRNFQFAHHLVLFDLPQVPDLLEQRIGRLDRIGQKHDVKLHVPFFVNSAQQVMLEWYHDGLNAFELTCPAGTSVYEEVEEMLLTSLQNPHDELAKRKLIEDTQTIYAQLKSKLEQGRDKLLEINSSGKGKIQQLIQGIEDSDNSPKLERFMTQLFDTIGVLQEEKDDDCYLLKQTESMHTQLPGLEEEGMTITYERQTATKLEHVHFFSWDHPMVQHAMDTITTDVQGKSVIGMNRDKSLPPGYYWLECLFVLSTKAEKHLQVNRYMPATPIKITVDPKGQQTDKVFHMLDSVNPKMSAQLVNALQSQIERAIQQATDIARVDADKIKQQCIDSMQSNLHEELQRLQSLSKVNKSIREEELDFIRNQLDALNNALGSAEVHLEAVRLVVNNH
ncbi:RNA polymerase-associated protein RapA [Aliiglaciecola lipolytica]|uniref:RNA polymerase-associated protein RapA n=1 Tax=Aliiglaciecola lipolytica TaxID=477689 RepID=UPI001C0A1836|nr:RNA polymerase-associated protein RapA [Aliiglaciecola lipolytica]MBU2878746.1 RNA polymerase-associated protein RapA [Aliiglaciecola lipolytica]